MAAYDPLKFFSKPNFAYKSIEPNSLLDSEYVNNKLLFLHKPYPVLKYIEVKMENYTLPDVTELQVGGSWNAFIHLPQFHARVNLFEQNFFPYNLFTKNFRVINNVFFWNSPLNLSVYTLLSDPMCVFIYKKNTDINHDNNIINVDVDDKNNNNNNNDKKSSSNTDEKNNIQDDNHINEKNYDDNDLFFMHGKNTSKDVAMSSVDDTAAAEVVSASTAAFKTPPTFTCIGFFKFANDAIYLTEYN